MQMKKYLFPTLREATAAMKEELGEDAIVMSARVVENAVTGKMFELIAAVDKPIKSSGNKQSAVPPVAPKSNSHQEASGEEDVQLQLEQLRKRIVNARNTGNTSQQKPSVSKLPVNSARKAQAEKHTQAIERGKQLVLDAFKQKLVNQELASSIVKQISDDLLKNIMFLKPADIEQFGKNALAQLIPTAPFEIKKHKGGPAIVALVGPTGVGKTTCIAKLAVISKLIHKLDVGLISLDTYRLGALDQMRIFSEISSIDFLSTADPNNLPKLLQEFKKKQLVFIDTAGKSQNNKKQLEEMKHYLDAVPVTQVLLTLSASTGSKTLLDAATKFSVFGYQSVIFTKTDEAASFGGLVNVLQKITKPCIYLTNGQVIPDDIIAADSEQIANMILSAENAENS